MILYRQLFYLATEMQYDDLMAFSYNNNNTFYHMKEHSFSSIKYNISLNV